jgi:hypothetical protein
LVVKNGLNIFSFTSAGIAGAVVADPISTVPGLSWLL